MPEDIFKVANLFFLAYDFQVLDLMVRCENEIINKLNSMNVVEVLLTFYPVKERTLKFSITPSQPKILSEVIPVSHSPVTRANSVPVVTVHELQEETKDDGEAMGVSTALDIDQDLRVERKSYR